MRCFASPRLLIAFLALALGLTGCASSGGGGGGDSAPRGSANRIIFEELEPVQQLDGYDAVRRLRPMWLRARGGASPQVLVDGNRQPGGLDALRSLRVSEIQEMRFLSSSDATTRYGTGFDGGAILVTTRRR
ncbi:MAG: hypothetical protein P8170_21400 [Gemmatimonadota bacterium]|jgi:hypothetical protein